MKPAYAYRTIFSSLLLAAIFPVAQVHAGGFSLLEMSAASVGNAHAGGAALAEDASTVYYNPAGLTRLSGSQFSISASGIRPSAKFQNNGSLSAASTPLNGSNGGDAGNWAGVPAIYYAMDAAPNIRFGIGVQAPFGLKTEYDAGWVGRYQALTSELKSININPALAFRLSDQLSLGAGLSAQYTDVKLSKAIDFGSVCIGTLGAANCVPLGYLPQAKDGAVNIDGTDWGYGFNLGAMYTPVSNARIGLAYRSKISHGLSGGAARFTRPADLPLPLAASSTFTDGGVKADLTLPESVNLSAYSELDHDWSAMGDIGWMRWSRLKELRIRFDNGAADSVTPEEWRNTWRVAAAVNYRYNDLWKFRGGLAYDQSPVNDEFRTPRIPDADRTWLGLGVQYKPSKQTAWDFGYAHLFVKDSAINKAERGAGSLVGNYKNDVNIISLQYSQDF